ncbi:MAG: hypothetical protein RR788_07985 [Erysipelotrichaceae bacterium]
MQNKTEYTDAIEDAKAAIITILLRNNFNFDYCMSRNLTAGDLQNMDLDILFEHLGQKISCDQAYNFYYFYQLQRRDEFKYYLNYNPKNRYLPEERRSLLYLLDYLNLNKADINAYVTKQQINFSIDDLNNLKLQILDELKVSKNFVINPHLITHEFKALLEQFNELQLLAIENEDKRLEEIKTATVPVIKKIKNNISTLSNDEFVNLYLLLDDLVIDPYESYGYYVIKNYMTTIIDKKM